MNILNITPRLKILYEQASLFDMGSLVRLGRTRDDSSYSRDMGGEK